MSKANEKKCKNPQRDEIGIVGNIAWATFILLPKVSQKYSQNGCIKLNNPVTGRWVELNIKPP